MKNKEGRKRRKEERVREGKAKTHEKAARKLKKKIDI